MISWRSLGSPLPVEKSAIGGSGAGVLSASATLLIIANYGRWIQLKWLLFGFVRPGVSPGDVSAGAVEDLLLSPDLVVIFHLAVAAYAA